MPEPQGEKERRNTAAQCCYDSCRELMSAEAAVAAAEERRDSSLARQSAGLEGKLMQQARKIHAAASREGDIKK